jgi:ATP-dependent exoDNAse (exonuclease V) beta subunit
MTDQAARDAALDIERHLLLQAPAGSGKTTVLAQRFLRALASVDDPEQVLAITFTRKAAAEMRERVLLALEGTLPASQPDRELWTTLRSAVLQQARRRSWTLEELPMRLRIQTIDSLCHEIARAMPLLGRMHQQLEIVDDATPAMLEAAAETLRLADGDHPLQADADLLLRRLDNDWERARGLLAAMLPTRNRWLPVLLETPAEKLGERVAASLARIARETLQGLHDELGPDLRREAAELARLSAGYRRDAGDEEDDLWRCWLTPCDALTVDSDLLSFWQAAVALALKSDGEWRAVVNVNHGFPPAERALKQRWKSWKESLQARPAALSRLRAVAALPAPHLDQEEAGALAALSRLLVLAATVLKLVFQQRGQVDHGEVAAVARQALREMDTPTELSIRQTLRVRHLLVDEFQDTSPDQLELIQELTQGWDDELMRSLFLVGDPMQSIYLFRNSEVGLFLRTRAEGVGAIRLQALQLGRNFRSVPPLVEWANAAFARIFPVTEDLRSSAVTFLAAAAARAMAPVAGAEAAQPAVQVWPQVLPGAEPEARQIAAEVARLRSAHPQWRMAVLVQTRALAPPVLAALAGAGVPTLGVDLAPLAERQVVRELIALGQALLHAGDRTAWLAVLHAPMCGLTLADLHQLCGEDDAVLIVDAMADDARVHALQVDARQRLARVAPLLREAWQGRGRTDLATAVEELWRRLGGWQACRDAGERSAALQYLAALRRAVEREGAPERDRLQSLADSLRDHGTSGGENPVEVLTIHHAKGLEWDVVFVPGLGRGTRADQPPLLRWLELPAPRGASDLLLAVRSVGETVGSDPLGRFIAGLQRERHDNERVRLVYVAVTRARQRLYLSGHAPWNRKLQGPQPRRRSLLQVLWPALREAFEAQPANQDDAAPALPARRQLAAPWFQLAADFRHPVLQPPVTATGLDGGARESMTAPEFEWVGPAARVAGTLVHGELELFATRGFPDAAAAESRLPYFVSRLREHGIGLPEARRLAAQIVARLQRMREDPRARWLLGNDKQEARSEWRLTGMVDGRLRNVIIDRSFVAEDGIRWVVDFKTSTHQGGDLAQFLQSEMERYRPQLELYVELARRAGPQPVRAALYFPWLGEFRELPVRQA